MSPLASPRFLGEHCAHFGELANGQVAQPHRRAPPRAGKANCDPGHTVAPAESFGPSGVSPPKSMFEHVIEGHRGIIFTQAQPEEPRH